MGGIAGELRFDGKISDLSTTKAMCDAQVHRGPDEDDYYANGAVSLGARRILAGSLTRHLYPLHNENHSIHLVLDGEIENCTDLRVKLEKCGHEFRSRASAELVVHSYEQWGTRCLLELTGSFAFALWDEPKEILWLTRDRFGIKPLYYHRSSRFLAFASEIKPLLRHPDIPAKPNATVLRDYLQRGYATGAATDTFFEGIGLLLPGNYLLIHADGIVKRQRYWNPIVSRELNDRTSIRAIEMTRDLFFEGVRQQIPLNTAFGVTLSGGIDSSSIVCAVKKVDPTRQRVKVFSALFPGQSIDESAHINIICEATEPEKHHVTVTADDFWHDLPTLLRCQETPLSLTFAYPQWRLMKCAREQGIRIMFEGHGGDELLCGYSLYYFYYFMTLIAQRKWRKLLVEVLRSRDQTWDEAESLFRTYSPNVGRYVRSLIRKVFSNENRSTRQISESSQIDVSSLTTDLASKLEIDMALDSIPTALVCVDKNSMWHSIEIRTPFLQEKFVAHCASLPLDQKMRDGWTKYAFRLAMKNTLPEQIRLRRNKIGFQMPHLSWIKGELRQKLRDFFSDPNLRGTRYYNSQTARHILSKKIMTVRDTNIIWRMLNVELWFREFFSEKTREMEK